jgi:hypothetical protein
LIPTVLFFHTAAFAPQTLTPEPIEFPVDDQQRMDDPGEAWPFWKFGLKKADLYTKLHDQYNTFASPIQDPEAFHHDVYEVSQEASTLTDFHRLLAERKEQRLREMNDSLEYASFEIIANPSLIGTEQWQHAIQLFRTKSLDSLVRYFASYLPENHPWHEPSYGVLSDAGSSVDSIDPSEPSDDDEQADDGSVLGEEPPYLNEPLQLKTDHLPPSPRSMTMCSDSSAASPSDVDNDAYIFDTLTPARSISFSDSESEHHLDTETAQKEQNHEHAQVYSTLPHHDKSGAAVSTPISFTDEPAPYDDEVDDEDLSQLPSEDLEADTPTPKPVFLGSSFFDAHASLPQRRHRSSSPSRQHPLEHARTADHDVRHFTPFSRLQRRAGHVMLERRRSPCVANSGIRKPLPESTSRSRGRGLHSS